MREREYKKSLLKNVLPSDLFKKEKRSAAGVKHSKQYRLYLSVEESQRLELLIKSVGCSKAKFLRFAVLDSIKRIEENIEEE